MGEGVVESIWLDLWRLIRDADLYNSGGMVLIHAVERESSLGNFGE